MGHIFLSYVSEDLKIAEKIRRDLEAAGFSVWRDKEQLQGGERWPERIRQAIQASTHVIVIWSANAGQSDFVEGECLQAQSVGVEIIPFKIDREPLPFYLLNRQFIDVAEIGYAAGLRKLLAGLGVFMEGTPPKHNLWLFLGIGAIVIFMIMAVLWGRSWISAITPTPTFTTTAAWTSTQAPVSPTMTTSLTPSMIPTSTITPTNTSAASPSPSITLTPSETMTPAVTLPAISEADCVPKGALRQKAYVNEALDGDSLKVRIEGNLYLVNYLGLVAPNREDDFGNYSH